MESKNTMQKVTLEEVESTNIVDENIDQLAALFPEVIIEDMDGQKINFDALESDQNI